MIFYYPKKIIFIIINFFRVHKDKIIGALILVIISSTVGVIVTQTTWDCVRYMKQKNLLKNLLSKLEPLEQSIQVTQQNDRLISPFSKFIGEETLFVSRYFFRYFLVRAGFYIISLNYIFAWDSHLDEIIQVYLNYFSIEEVL